MLFFRFKSTFTDIPLTSEQQEYFDLHLKPFFDKITELLNNEQYNTLLKNVPGIINLELTNFNTQVHQVVSKGNVDNLKGDFNKILEKIQITQSVIDELITNAEISGIYKQNRLRAFVVYYKNMQKNNKTILNYFGK
jgi:hypothetical protein